MSSVPFAQRGPECGTDDGISPRPRSRLREYLIVLVQAGLLALILRSFVFQSFTIPSESMVPTLLVGDYIFVSKFSYGYSRHSLPFSPPLPSGRWFDEMPERGDVVVFKLPSDTTQDYVKRLVGLPGDRIQLVDSVLHINGRPVSRTREFDCDLRNVAMKNPLAACYRESLPEGGASYTTLDLHQGFRATTPVYTVPPGHYFMLGDNRDNSLDSRSKVGMVPHENLVGRARLIYFSSSPEVRFWQVFRFFESIRYPRLFQVV